MRTVYKVTRVEGDGYYSIFATPRIRVEYIPEVVTKPKIKDTYLLAFHDLHDARVFAIDECYDVEFCIWEAQAIVEGHPKFLHLAYVPWSNIQYVNFWQSTSWKIQASRETGASRITFPAPMGTVICSEITLTRKAQHEMGLEVLND